MTTLFIQNLHKLPEATVAEIENAVERHNETVFDANDRINAIESDLDASYIEGRESEALAMFLYSVETLLDPRRNMDLEEGVDY